MDIETTRARLIRAAWIALVLGGLYCGFRWLPGVLLPFLIAGAVAEGVHGPVDRLTARTRLPRRVVSALVVTGALAVVGVLLWGAIYGLTAAAQAAVERLPGWMESAEKGLAALRTATGAIGERLPAPLAGALEEAPSTLARTLTGAATGFLTGMAGRLPERLLTATVTVIACYIVSADYHKLARFLRQVIKPAVFDRICAVRRVVLSKLGPLARGYGILLLLTFAELAVGLALLGVEGAVGKAALIAAVDLMPVLGTGTVLIPWAAIALLQGQTGMGAGLLGLYAAVTLVRNFVEPRVIGAQIRLSPLFVLICMFTGYRLFGFQGLVLAPFVASVGKELVEQGAV